ncbi:MAG: hypothetical protein GY696_11370 [Gammaproteobacteria bacterium]|nr:hypothetical protein [Gammaproteobacteria bacterium]
MAVACVEMTFSENRDEQTRENTEKPETKTLLESEELKPFKPGLTLPLAQEGESYSFLNSAAVEEREGESDSLLNRAAMEERGGEREQPQDLEQAQHGQKHLGSNNNQMSTLSTV